MSERRDAVWALVNERDRLKVQLEDEKALTRDLKGCIIHLVSQLKIPEPPSECTDDWRYYTEQIGRVGLRDLNSETCETQGCDRVGEHRDEFGLVACSVCFMMD